MMTVPAMNIASRSLDACYRAEYAEFAALQLKEYARQLVRAGEVAAEDGAAAAASACELWPRPPDRPFCNCHARLGEFCGSVGLALPQRQSLSVLVATTRVGYLS
jgi:hypothetical protein